LTVANIINLTYAETWPADLVAYLNTHCDLFANWERGAGLVSPKEYDRTIHGLRDILNKYSLVGWHCTRLTEMEIATIVESGMELPGAEMLNGRIGALERGRIITAEVAAKLRANNQAHESNRAGMIWFCFFPPHIGGEDGIERFFRSWGGEALYNSQEDDPETGPVLTRIGVPCLIEAIVPIASLGGAIEFKIVSRYLVNVGHRTTKPLDHEDRAKSALPSRNIRRVIRFPEAEFIALTQCDSWEVSLQITPTKL
jgi:hypothetical protein